MSKSEVMGRMAVVKFSDDPIINQNAWNNGMQAVGLLWMEKYSGLNLNQDKATKPQTVQIVRQGEATPYWFKFNPL